MNHKNNKNDKLLILGPSAPPPLAAIAEATGIPLEVLEESYGRTHPSFTNSKPKDSSKPETLEKEDAVLGER